MNSLSRRTFLGQSATLAAAAASTTSSARGADSPNERIVVGAMGLNRGKSVASRFAAQAGCELRYCCDVDSVRADAAAASIEKQGHRRPVAVQDFRRILDDKEVDVLICAAPNHWHAPAGILACDAGKHAYIEKPCSHNPREGELLIAAARKYGRCVQLGSQRRSCPEIIEGIRLIHDGAIGDVHFSKSWYANLRGPINPGEKTRPPASLDYELWQGPAPRTPFVSNRLHYNWHWFWDYGNGELGNNGIHSIDLSRWGLKVDYPTRVTSAGGRYFFDDEQQTPDTHVVSFEFGGGKQIVWEGLSCNRHGTDGESFGVSFQGSDGSIVLTSWGYRHFDRRNKLITEKKGKASDVIHVANLLTAVRASDHGILNAEIEEGHKSTLLCHLGNIAHRTGSTLNCDPADGRIKGDDSAMQFWSREYAPGWEPTVG